MLTSYEIEELARRRYESMLANVQLTQEYNRSIRKGKARKALERVIKENVRNGACLGEVKREMLAVLHRVAG